MKRYTTKQEIEPLRDSIKRRITMIWECLTFRPRDEFSYDFRPFRKSATTYVEVLPGEPGYETARTYFLLEHSEGIGTLIAKEVATRSPWFTLIKKDEH